jgi:hypothetical protein
MLAFTPSKSKALMVVRAKLSLKSTTLRPDRYARSCEMIGDMPRKAVATVLLLCFEAARIDPLSAQ